MTIANPRRARVLLVDDHAVVHAGYRLPQNAHEIAVLAEADTGRRIVAA